METLTLKWLPLTLMTLYLILDSKTPHAETDCYDRDVEVNILEDNLVSAVRDFQNIKC